jgi:hypothetical protein
VRTVEIRYGQCEVYVEGADMRCPLCGTLVRSGQNHSCKVIDPAKPQRKRRQRHEVTTK